VAQFVRFLTEGGPAYGQLVSDTVHELTGDLFGPRRPAGPVHRLSDIELLTPLDPRAVRMVVGVANNYNVPAAPPREAPHPRWFSKLPSALGLHEATIELPAGGANLNYEGELVAIIGRTGRRIALEEADQYIFGYTIGNDWSENTWYVEKNGWNDPSRMISKSVDGWAALYPVVHTDVDVSDRQIEIRLNGRPVARGQTSDMINSPAFLVHYLSHFVTVSPGDIIFTGTVAPPVFPGDRRNMFDGDVVEVEISGLGRLRNPVRAPVGVGQMPPRQVLNGRSLL
jgi:2-keto-4-pentenoate hydratase/2-oxohepta-3-ene-1,7-dioic acid hydratase in catechol pathway